jgi:hypothetical protein
MIHPSSALPTTVVSDGKRFSYQPEENGTFRLSSARNIKISAIEVHKNGGHITVADGDGRHVWAMPSVFTGSFYVEAGIENGLIVRHGAVDGVVPEYTIVWQANDD